MSIRQADLSELDQPSVPKNKTRQVLHDWWNRWETLPAVKRDRTAAEVLAEERQRD